jgi:hypothetical protein
MIPSVQTRGADEAPPTISFGDDPVDVADSPLLAIAATTEFDLPLLIERLDPTTVDGPKGEKRAAYVVSLKAVVPEKFAAALVAVATAHRLVVRVRGAGGPD